MDMDRILSILDSLPIILNNSASEKLKDIMEVSRYKEETVAGFNFAPVPLSEHQIKMLEVIIENTDKLLTHTVAKSLTQERARHEEPYAGAGAAHMSSMGPR